MTIFERVRRLHILVVAVIAWLAVLLQVALVVRIVTAQGGSPLTGVVNTLSYFTVLTNLLVAVIATAGVMRKPAALLRPGVMTATAVYIFVVGLIYSLILRALWAPTGLQKVADLALHDITPVLYVTYWLLFVRKDQLGWKQPLAWLAYPTAYVVYTFVRGAMTGVYVYPFTDVPRIGYALAARNAVLALIGFYGLGLAAVALGRLAALVAGGPGRPTR